MIIAVTKFTARRVGDPRPRAGDGGRCSLRLNRQYEQEAAELERDARAAATAPILRRHVVLVLRRPPRPAAARAIQYARTLTPDELRAVHFAVD